jgi:hypothetical protein
MAFNSAYSPFYYSDSEQILRSDDLMSTNQISYNGAAFGGFYGAYGLALDTRGRIYVADTYNCRIFRRQALRRRQWESAGGRPRERYDGSELDLSLCQPRREYGPEQYFRRFRRTVYTGGRVRFVDGMTGVLTSSGAVGPVVPTISSA